MKNILFITLLSGILFTACNGGDEAYTPAADSEVAPLNITTQDSSRVLANPGQANPLLNPMVPQNGPLPGAQSASAGTQATNPAHGLPGHRCDIAVGAPLGSPAQGQALSAPPVSSPAPITQVPQVQPSQKIATPPGMNPPHGEPGHRCEIAVGAPLNSSAAPITAEPAKKDSGSK